MPPVDELLELEELELDEELELEELELELDEELELDDGTSPPPQPTSAAVSTSRGQLCLIVGEEKIIGDSKGSIVVMGWCRYTQVNCPSSWAKVL